VERRLDSDGSEGFSVISSTDILVRRRALTPPHWTGHPEPAPGSGEWAALPGPAWAAAA